MEPSPSMRYNLRSRGRIIGNRLLRLRRGVPVYNHHHSCQKPCRPSVKKIQKPCGPSIHRGTDEELGNQRPTRSKESYRLERLRFFGEEERYKVYDYGDGIMTAFEKVGDFHQLHILGVPKSFEYMQNSSDDDVPVKHFYARIHQAPKKNTHVDYCEPFEGEGPPLRASKLKLMEKIRIQTTGMVTRTLMPPKKEIRGALAEFRRRR
ncbi:uncharacterized protein LOC130940720 isoform X3 [Arachis stenosperma]|nr:uncharacterized protein LOC130940720 isoform X3 [Arachis stenosperma]XP_057724922.1 uncharacterized protein LOC130940720 isoform X3 [Arachis stenosperma]